MMTSPGEAGCTQPEFRACLMRYVRSQAFPVEKFGHQPRLYALTRRVGEGLSYDDDVVFAAAWLHDLGVFVGHRPEDPIELAGWDNVAYAMRRAPEILLGCGFAASKVAEVVEAIRTHQPGCQPAGLEAAILRDADILEQLGAIGVLRVAAKVGRDTRYPTFSDVIRTLDKALAELPDKLQLDNAKVLAQPRVLLLKSFLSELEAEAFGELH